MPDQGSAHCAKGSMIGIRAKVVRPRRDSNIYYQAKANIIAAPGMAGIPIIPNGQVLMRTQAVFSRPQGAYSRHCGGPRAARGEGGLNVAGKRFSGCIGGERFTFGLVDLFTSRHAGAAPATHGSSTPGCIKEKTWNARTGMTVKTAVPHHPPPFCAIPYQRHPAR